MKKVPSAKVIESVPAVKEVMLKPDWFSSVVEVRPAPALTTKLLGYLRTTRPEPPLPPEAPTSGEPSNPPPQPPPPPEVMVPDVPALAVVVETLPPAPPPSVAEPPVALFEPKA